jgi:hypothetical protein
LLLALAGFDLDNRRQARATFTRQGWGQNRLRRQAFGQLLDERLPGLTLRTLGPSDWFRNRSLF